MEFEMAVVRSYSLLVDRLATHLCIELCYHYLLIALYSLANTSRELWASSFSICNIYFGATQRIHQFFSKNCGRSAFSLLGALQLFCHLLLPVELSTQKLD